MAAKLVARAFPALLVLALVFAACGSDSTTTGDGLRGRVTVFAAASLTDAFQEIGRDFESEHEGVDIVFSFGGSPTLRTQIEQGARADVFASADERQMDIAREKGLLGGTPLVFARNSLVIITPAANRARLETPADLARPGLKLVIANQDVPAGEFARKALTALSSEPAYGAGFADRVLANVVSQESNVKQVVAKVELGEADAGIVYVSDVTPSVAPHLRTIELPARYRTAGSYMIAVLKDGADKPAANAFVDFVLSDRGQEVLRKHGFDIA